MAASTDVRTIYCLVFDYCGFPIWPHNGVYFFNLLGTKYTAKTVSLQATKTIRDANPWKNGFPSSSNEDLEYETDLSLAELQDLGQRDIICLPGGVLGAPHLANASSLAVTLKPVLDKARWIVTEGLGSTILAAAGLLDGKRAVVTRAGLAEARLHYPAVRWETGPFFRPQGKILHGGKFIMTDNLGRQAPLDELATATAAAKFFTMLVERGEEPNETSSIQSVITAAPSEMEQNITITEVQVETLASRIRLEREDTQIIRMAEDFSLRLACEGYMEACNVIVAELLTHNPDALNFLVKRGLEMVWHTVGPRPDTPYPQLTEAELLEMEEEQRYYDLHERNTVTITERVDVPFQQLAPDQVGELAAALAAVQHLAEKKLISRIELGAGAFGTSYDEGPITMPTEEEERRGLEVFRNYISRRDEDDRPMNVRLLSVYANLALKYDLEEEGKRWLDLCLREVLKSTSNWVELASVASGRYTSVQLGNGALQQLTGTTPEIAKRAGQDLATALRERWQTGEARPFVSLSWPDLLRRIQAASDNSQQASDAGTHEPYMREAATEQSIAAAEERLGIILPADYKTFLRLTNGTGSSSSKTGEPELAPVEEIAWDEETPRICMFKVEPLPRIHGKEWNALPDLKRVLRISVDGWEEYVYLIEPEMVALLPGQEDAVKEGRWRASTWAAWRADHIPYESFRDYMERLLLES